MSIVDVDRHAGVERAAGAAPARRPRVRPTRRADRRARAHGRRRARCRASRERFDGCTAPLEVTRDEMRAGARRAPASVRAAHSQRGPATSRAVATRAGAARLARSRVAPGVTVEQRVEPLDRVGCYVPGGRFPLPSSLLMTAIPARVAGVREIIAVCPRPEPVVMAAALEAGRDAAVPGRRRARDRGARVRHRDDSARGQDRRARQPLRRRGQGARRRRLRASTSTPARPRSSSSRARAGRAGSPPISSRRPSTTPTRAPCSSPREPRARERGGRRGRRAQMPAGRSGTRSLAAHGGIIVTGIARRSDGAGQPHGARAPGRRRPNSRRPQVRCAGRIFVGALHRTGGWRLRDRIEPRAADRGAAARFRGGLSAADFVRVMSVQRMTGAGLRGIAETIVTLARAEGLTAHARSIELRTALPDTHSVRQRTGRSNTRTRRVRAGKS